MTARRATDDTELLDALRRREHWAFARLVDQHTGPMLRIAQSYVPSREVAEDVVQETWIAVLKGIDRFEGRSALRTWLYSILVNLAKRRGVAESRESEKSERVHTVDPARFWGLDDATPGHWKEHPSPFPLTPEGSVLGGELLQVVNEGLSELPQRQKLVVALRDVLGFDSDEVCQLLDITLANQRVLLHRGRAVVRQRLEDYLVGQP
ncbi:MAG: RNA polymerase subunit sigma-24 [Mycobacterium sp.]|jgi:RNA polymerase sigma-70 factor (ECF subfamily)|uniref:RNA polymerase sigma factor n=1 Tax=Mycobacterium TaxID=1763 RepID=UPI000CA8F205|nr:MULTISPECIES: sigma-70 family RNA polymerase sigma factor [Mycobacterium]PJE02343.1 MAG: RNA polymerase subunit sigma-24 [Mycobacterium sp.]PJE03820.1 MAG: RNA polymerase subunit sigma-24 [Mycobacterium sp.]TDL02958.1 sigma-70 family RNA polymerase sigma factor [Mycobacterium paragordonae]VAZ66457.1 ECF RNA polymerase sigma-E factor [Mycobacterium kansasii]